MTGHVVQHFFRGIDRPPSGGLLCDTAFGMPPLASFEMLTAATSSMRFTADAQPGAFSVAESFPSKGPVGSFLPFHLNPRRFNQALLFILLVMEYGLECVDRGIPYGLVRANVIVIATSTY